MSDQRATESPQGTGSTAVERLPLLHPADLDTVQRSVYDAVAGGPRASAPFRSTDAQGRLLGPFNALLYAPAVGEALQRLGAVLRFEGSLPARTRELVICAVAGYWRSDYEWYAHSRVALGVGVTPDELEVLRHGETPDGLAPAEEAALRLASALLRDRFVDDGVHADAVAHHGQPGVVELCALVGYYQTLAGLLAAMDVPAPTEGDPT